MANPGNDAQGRQRSRQVFKQRLGARKGYHFVILGCDQLSGCRHLGCVAPGFKFIEHQPAQGEVMELARSDRKQAVVRRDENEAFNGALAGKVDRDAAA